MYEPEKIVKRLKQLRKDHSYSQQNVAEYLGITQGNYAMIEHGRQLPTIKQLIYLSILYKKTIDYLVVGEISKK